MDEQARRRFERWQLESLAGGDTAKAGLFGKTLGLLGLDADGNRAATSWTDAAKHTAGNLINAPQDIGNQLLDLQDYQPVYGTGASNPEDRARAGQQAVSTFGLAGLAPLGGVAAGRLGRAAGLQDGAGPRPGVTRMDGSALYANSDNAAVPGLLAQDIAKAPDRGLTPAPQGRSDGVSHVLAETPATVSQDAWRGNRPYDRADEVAAALRSAYPDHSEFRVTKTGSAGGDSAYVHTPWGDVRISDHFAYPKPGLAWSDYGNNASTMSPQQFVDLFSKNAAKGTPDHQRQAAVERRLDREVSESARRDEVQAQRAEFWRYHDMGDATQTARDKFLKAQKNNLLFSNSKEAAVPGLAMDHASRMQRARELGYDPDTTLYHGTNKEFDSFDTGKSGSGVGTAGQLATWLTPSPAEASAWAKVTGGGNGDRVLPVHTRMTNPKIISSAELTQLRIPSKPDTLAYNSKVFEAELEKARAAGHDGVVFKNVDEGFAHGANDQIAVFDPSHIRSKFAAFDPSQSHSSNLLAANAREGAAPGLGITAQSDQNDPYRTALQMQARRKMLGLPD